MATKAEQRAAKQAINEKLAELRAAVREIDVAIKTKTYGACVHDAKKILDRAEDVEAEYHRLNERFGRHQW